MGEQPAPSWKAYDGRVSRGTGSIITGEKMKTKKEIIERILHTKEMHKTMRSTERGEGFVEALAWVLDE